MQHVQYMHMYGVMQCSTYIVWVRFAKLHMCAYTDNTAMNTDLMVIPKCRTNAQYETLHSTDMCRFTWCG